VYVLHHQIQVDTATNNTIRTNRGRGIRVMVYLEAIDGVTPTIALVTLWVRLGQNTGGLLCYASSIVV
jgi:hypothetical protein